MSVDSLKTSEIEIGLLGNSISNHTDGSMLFRDRLVPGIRLIDLVGGEVVIDPSVTIAVSSSDWQFDSYDSYNNRNFYKVNIYFGYEAGICFASASLTPEVPWQAQDGNEISVTTTVDVSGGFIKPITFHEMLISNTQVNITSTEKIDCNVRLKRV
jgi:hypothetical protein